MSESQGKPSTQLVGNLGLYWTCYQLTLRGWNSMPTARNARGVDILAYSADAKHINAIQVKALSKRSPVPLGNDLDKCMGDFWIIVTDVARESPSAFIMTPTEVIERAHKGQNGDRVSYWLQPTKYDCVEFKNAWGRIGHGGLKEPIPSE